MSQKANGWERLVQDTKPGTERPGKWVSLESPGKN